MKRNDEFADVVGQLLEKIEVAFRVAEEALAEEKTRLQIELAKSADRMAVLKTEVLMLRLRCK